MTKTIKEYPVTFPYGATSWPYSRLKPHRGDDRAAPTGTPIKVRNKIIGYVGTTGYSTGPHLHSCKWLSRGLLPFLSFRKYYAPRGEEFKVKGRVVFAGYLGTAGNCVIIKEQRSDRKRVFFAYMHLVKINVKKNDWIK